MGETWFRTVLVFAFYLLMLTVAVFCCSGCTPPPPVSVDKVQIRNHSAKVLEEQTRLFNEEMERRFKQP